MAVILLLISFTQDKTKTKEAVKQAGKKGLNLLPALLGMIALIGAGLSIFSPEVIKAYLGQEMSFTQIGVVSLLGAVAMIPSLIALPLAGSLVDSGAAYTSVTAFITTLTMVGFVTLPMELKELGKKFTLYRNLLAFVFAVLIALMMGLVI